jgi:hypothetical protein
MCKACHKRSFWARIKLTLLKKESLTFFYQKSENVSKKRILAYLIAEKGFAPIPTGNEPGELLLLYSAFLKEKKVNKPIFL